MIALPGDAYQPFADEVYIPPVPDNTYEFLKKVWFSFVNKVVSLTFSNEKYCFEHAVFEAIQGNYLKIVVSSSQFSMKEMTSKETPRAFKEFINRTQPIHVDDRLNASANIIRNGIIEVSEGKDPSIDGISFRKDQRVHPKIKALLTPTMRYGVCIPLFIKGSPIGLLWGIRKHPLTQEQMTEVSWQFKSLYEGISSILSNELDRDRDDYYARRAIEKIEPFSKISNIIYSRQGPRMPPVKSVFSYSYRFKKDYRMDASYIIPTSRGFSISMKRYLPRYTNKTKRNLLMIPGFFCNRSCMDRLAREMSLSHGYKVYSLDVRGRSKFTLPRRGMTDWTVDDYIMEDFPAALAWIRHNHPDEQTVIFGHSMGGMIPKFYTGSYEKIKRLHPDRDMPDPYSQLAGIVSITSPSYIDLKANIPGFDLIKKGASFATNNAFGEFFFRAMGDAIPYAVKSIDLNNYFKLIHNLGGPMRMFSFNVGRNLVTLKDFIGYKQITPPEWYFLLEDVFCEESIKVILQFVRSQMYDNSFKSYDGKVDYTRDQENIRMPVYSVIGSEDTLAPPETVKYGYELFDSDKKKRSVFKQGHLGIIMHPRTVRKMAVNAHEWIQQI